MLKNTSRETRETELEGQNANRTKLLCEGWEFRQVGKKEWYPAMVPGNNFMDLRSNALIDDPFHRANETVLQWVEKESWEYKAQFNVSSSDLRTNQVILVFEGLDTYADVYLNGEFLFESNNMFMGWSEEVSDLLIEGENQLHILFHSPLNHVKEEAERSGILYPAGNDHSEENLSVYSRKAPYHFGWDWGPRFITSGIWRPVYLERIDKASFQDVYIQQELSETKARLEVEMELMSSYHGNAEIVIKCLNHSLESIVHPVALVKGINSCKISFSISDYVKWWPRPLGEPHLYKFRIDLAIEGAVVASKSKKIGLRKIEVINEKDKYGESFYFKVNNVPVFAKGANYIPQDSFLGEVDEGRYEKLFENVVSANMNMLRIWGGGIYENDIFYDLADEHGILVWQDFMFACTMYPGSLEFLENVRSEAIYNVKRLREHACICIWCGNNEIKMGWNHWGWQKEFKYSKNDEKKLEEDYTNLFEKLLPEVVEKYDENRFYLPSSPISNWGEPKDFTIGDNHYWGVWHGHAPFEDFKKSVPRFMSEFGFQSFPLLKSVKKYSLVKDWDLESEVMRQHQKHPRGNKLIEEYLLRDYKEPRDFEAFLFASQILQAEGMRIGIEAHRRNKPFCMGTLYWQLNDCWPVASWSSIDYYGTWKALHYFVKKQYSDVLVSCDISEDELKAYVVSDFKEAKNGILDIQVCHFSGEVLYSYRQEVQLEPNGCHLSFKKTLKELIGENDSRCLVILASFLTTAGDELSTNAYYLHSPKDLKLTIPKVEYKLELESEFCHVTLTTDVLAKNLHLEFANLEGNFTDNFFDLVPGKPRRVSFPLNGQYDGLEPNLLMKSLIDTY